MNKEKLVDIIFLIYVVLIIPIASFFYFAFATTNLDNLLMVIGAIILWGVMIPYPLYKYTKTKFFEKL